ncbi:MAG: DUF4190 domain-containing protein [Acidimicrobiales bacterium]
MGSPGWGPAPPTSRRTNGLAIASLVLGIVALTGLLPLAVVALVLGSRARRQIRESRGAEEGEGMATAGVVLGWIGVGLMILIGIGVVLFILLFAGLATSGW